jgi:sugar/nucleoside kinase (ribokinase family)
MDVLVRATDEELVATGLAKGAMELVDLARARSIYGAMPPAVEVSGGSAANTVAGVAALGGRAGFVGKVADDALGRAFTHDIRAAGVTYHPVVAPAGDGARPAPGGGDGASGPLGDDLGTGHCLVLVTADGERTMATHLGVATTIGPDDVPADLVARGHLLYLEGYLWDLAPAKEAMRRAVTVAHAHDGAVALSLSDPFCVERHREEFLGLLEHDVDVLFGNEEEIVRLFAVPTLEAGLDAAAETGLLVAVTLGPGGSVVVAPEGPERVPAVRVDAVVDTTGAGDLYAAGFLYGLTHGRRPGEAAALGALCAAEIIGHLGARPQGDLQALAAAAGLL